MLAEREKGIQHLSCDAVKLKTSHLQHLHLSATAALAGWAHEPQLVGSLLFCYIYTYVHLLSQRQNLSSLDGSPTAQGLTGPAQL